MPTSQPPMTDDPRWKAVVARDPRADATFFYSVETTGVYCRPSCGARRPRPENVRFHATAEAAARAGFRPCRRCRPDEAPLAERRAALVADACRRIESAEAPPRLDALAAEAGLSRAHFHRVFREVTGLSAKAWAAAHRRGRVRAGLAGAATVTEALYDAGFGSSGRFYAAADGALGMTPGAFRRGGAGVEVRFALGACRLGEVLVAASARGVCAVLLGDDPARLERDLAAAFPRARLVAGDAAFAATVAAVVACVDDPTRGLALPLDLQGTAFQERVWRALGAIPAGTTVTYAELAARLGSPTAARAVARACASNTLAVVVPCHRVVRAGGALAGYRWGVARKRALLDAERER